LHGRHCLRNSITNFNYNYIEVLLALLLLQFTLLLVRQSTVTFRAATTNNCSRVLFKMPGTDRYRLPYCHTRAVDVYRLLYCIMYSCFIPVAREEESLVHTGDYIAGRRERRLTLPVWTMLNAAGSEE